MTFRWIFWINQLDENVSWTEWGTDSELVWVCSSAPASCWWACSACWETKASWSLILDSSLWRWHTPRNTQTQTHTEMRVDTAHIANIHNCFLCCAFSTYKSITLVSSQFFIHCDPAVWYLTNVRAKLLHGCLDMTDLLGEPTIQSSLCHCLSVQSLQAAGDSLEHGLVSLSGQTNTGVSGSKVFLSHYWKRFPKQSRLKCFVVDKK